MTVTSALMQIGYISYLAAATGVYTLVRYLYGSRHLDKTSVAFVSLAAAAMPVVVAIILVGLGYPAIVRDTSFTTYLLLSSSIVVFFAVFWPIVIAKEGLQSPTLHALFKRDARTKPALVRMMYGVVLAISAALFYWLFAEDVAMEPCRGSRCRAAEMALALRGTNFGPLLYASFLNSMFVAFASGALTLLLTRHLSSDHRDDSGNT
ncbi:hypothetical protein [Aestuariivirga sp.]|jgi:hypothetical protein|uniref:hypothetical protein n=1 Tax=Aestuariivirga sp. TaxID=2650926 RepID=UPI0037842DE2